MTMTAPVSGLSLATLARLVALPLPSGAPPSAQQARSPDVVVFSSAPFRMLSDLASAGLQQLSALLPALEKAVLEESAAPLGHLAKVAGAAARQIGEGHVALLAEGPERVAAALRGEIPSMPPASQTEGRQTLRTLARQIGTAAEGEPLPEPLPDARTSETLRAVARQIGMAERFGLPQITDPDATPIQRWLSEANLVLHDTSDALERAERQLSAQIQAAPPNAPAQDTPTIWALGQIAAAQAQVTAACGSLGQSLRAPRRPAVTTAASFKLQLDHLAGATTMVGTLLILAVLWFAGGVWSAVSGALGLVGLGFWLLRIRRASKGIRLDVRP